MSHGAVAAIRLAESGAGIRKLETLWQEKVNYNHFLLNLISRH